MAAEKAGVVIVDEVVPKGNADAAGMMQGDKLLATTARAQVGNITRRMSE